MWFLRGVSTMGKSRLLFALIAVAAFLLADALVVHRFYQYLVAKESRPPKNFVARVETSPKSDTSTETQSQTQAQNQVQTPAVLGDSDGSLNFVSSQNSSSDGGVVVLSTNKPAEITVESNKLNGAGQFKLYKVSRDDLLNYLLYKKDSGSDYGATLHKIYQIDRKQLTLQASFSHEIVSVPNQTSKTILPLPLDGTGIWFLEGKVNDLEVETMVVRSNLAAIVHEGDNQDIFWVQDTTYTSVPEAHVQLFNVENSVSNLGEMVTDGSGLATVTVNAALDIALVTRGDDLTIVPVNLENLNYRMGGSNRFWATFSQRQVNTKAFMFTDRFLYKPGDTIHFKAIIRQDDDADYSIVPHTVTVTFGNDSDKPTWARELVISELGTVDGTIQVPADAKAGQYLLLIKDGDEYVTDTFIQVAQFRKPDTQISIDTDQLLYLPGQTISTRITGENFLGQPIRNQEVRYKVYQAAANESGDYQSLRFPKRVGSFFSKETEVLAGTTKLDSKGSAQLDLVAKNTTGYRQFWTIQIEYLDASGAATNDAIQVLVQPGNFVIESAAESGQQYFFGQASTFPLKLSKNKSDAKVNKVKIQGKLMVNTSNGEKVLEQDDLQAITDGNGQTNLPFTAKEKQSYQLQLTATDDEGNLIRDEESFYADDIANLRTQTADVFTVTTDKKSYTVGETAKVTVKAKPEIKNVFVSLGRNYSRSHQILTLNNGSATLEIPIIEKYQPNFFMYIGSFLGDDWESKQVKVPVRTDDKKITVRIVPSQKTYGPGETASFDITATDGLGRPVKTDLAFWLFDKALLELHGAYFEGIFNQFWSERWAYMLTNYSFQGITSNSAEGGGGCFVGDTLITMADGQQKRIDQIKTGDFITTYTSLDTKNFVKAQVIGTHRVDVAGYLVINGTLKLTPEHKLLVNNQWKTAGEIAIGDQLLTDQETAVSVTSIEWIRSKVPVYNLQIEKFHTFFANHIYVHNDKGEARSIFKDTAYWNPHVQTDEAGHAQLTVVLPDNLTTWVAAAVAANSNTQVGDGQVEFKVSKDIVVRPIFPLFLRVGDTANLTAQVHNFTTNAEKFTTRASFSAGDLDRASQDVTVPAQDLVELTWPVRVTKPATAAVFQVKAQNPVHPALGDDVQEKLPVYEYGSWQTSYQRAQGSSQLPIQITAGTDPARTKTVLTLKPSRYPELKAMLNTLLGRSKYGSSENAAGALIAASLITQHGRELGLTYTPDALAKAVKDANSVLARTQGETGVWSSQNKVEMAQTRFAIEGLVTAQKAGLAIDQAMLDKAITTLAGMKFDTWSDQVEQQYVYSLLPNRDLPRVGVEVQKQHAGVMSQAVLANLRQKFGSSEDATALLAVAHENDTAFWLSYVPPQDSTSRWLNIALPTAWSARALLELDQSPDKVAKALDYLYRNQADDSESLAIQALATVQYELKTQQLAPNYTYRVFVNDQLKREGQVTRSSQELAPLQLGTGAAISNAQIRIEQIGTGTLFSQLETTEFFTDRQVTAQSHNLSLTRKYLSTKKPGEPTQPGDMVIVQFEVNGLGGGETAVEIEDYLPSGLVAIDQSLDNGNFDENGQTSTYASQEITQQGMKLTFSRLFSDNGIYSYKTRVVSAGVFDAPPAVVKLTGDPSIWASSRADQLKIDGKSALEVLAATNKIGLMPADKMGLDVWSLLINGLFVGIGLVIGGVVWSQRARISQSIQTIRQKIRDKNLPPPVTQ